MKRLSFFAIFLIYMFFGLSSYAGEVSFITEIQQYGKKVFCKITWVDDGDTFNISCTDGVYSNVRLLGINAPDKDIANNQESCYYSKAKEYMETKIGKPVVVVFYGSDLCKDPYKGCRNLVRLIDVKNSSDIGQSMILYGLAFSWTNFSMIPSETKALYDWMERISLKRKLGLWGECSVQIHDTVSGVNSSIPNKMTTYLQ